MIKPRTCKICANLFTPGKYHPQQEVCFRPECQQERQFQNQRKWRKKNPNYFKYKGRKTIWEKRRAHYLQIWRKKHKK